MSAPTARSASADRASTPSVDDRRSAGPIPPTTPARGRSAGSTRPPDGGDLPCRRTDGDLWFAESPDAVERAKAACAPCPFRQPCLQGALERGEPWGVWGGQLLVHGEVVARKRPRGRPRKNAVAA